MLVRRWSALGGGVLVLEYVAHHGGSSWQHVLLNVVECVAHHGTVCGSSWYSVLSLWSRARGGIHRLTESRMF